MTQYIDKATIVAEIERIIDVLEKNSGYTGIFGDCQLPICEKILSFLDTLETKEVDLEKEFYDFLDTLIGKDNGHLSEDELFSIAEYFYELGLKAQNNITVSNIDDVIRENGLDPDSKEAKVFKEAYCVAIDKTFENFKKGE